MKKLFSTRYSDLSVSFAMLLLRITMGGLMIPHGYEKLLGFASNSSRFPDPFHIGSSLTMILVIFAEFFCAVLVLVGLMTRLATIPLIIAMSVAVFYTNQGRVFSGGELAALYLAGFLAILLAGPGKMSMDRLIGK